MLDGARCVEPVVEIRDPTKTSAPAAGSMGSIGSGAAASTVMGRRADEQRRPGRTVRVSPRVILHAVIRKASSTRRPRRCR